MEVNPPSLPDAPQPPLPLPLLPQPPWQPASPWPGKAPLAPLNPEHFNPWVAVLAYAKIPFWVDHCGDVNIILVYEADLERARQELDAYEAVNAEWPKQRNQQDEHEPLFRDNAIFVNMVFFAALFRFYIWLEYTGRSITWKSMGLWDVYAVRDGQWWRNITALTLHADISHILSNMFWGFLFGSLTGTQIGAGFGMLLMVTCGAMGNATMTILLDTAHQSLGASTMVFSLLGILTAVRSYDAWKHREPGHSGIVKMIPWIPLLGGIGMTAVYGGAPGTDTLAHLCGFFWGIVFGSAMPACKALLNTFRYQVLAALAAIAVFLLAWLAACR